MTAVPISKMPPGAKTGKDSGPARYAQLPGSVATTRGGAEAGGRTTPRACPVRCASDAYVFQVSVQGGRALGVTVGEGVPEREVEGVFEGVAVRVPVLVVGGCRVGRAATGALPTSTTVDLALAPGKRLAQTPCHRPQPQ